MAKFNLIKVTNPQTGDFELVISKSTTSVPSRSWHNHKRSKLKLDVIAQFDDKPQAIERLKHELTPLYDHPLNHNPFIPMRFSVQGLEGKDNPHYVRSKAYSRRGKPVAQFSLQGDLITVFDNASKAASSVGMPIGSICKAANGTYKSCAGFKWQYA